MSSESDGRVHDATLTAIALVRAWRRQNESEVELLLDHINPAGVAIALAMFASDLIENIAELSGQDPEHLIDNWQAEILRRAAKDPEESD